MPDWVSQQLSQRAPWCWPSVPQPPPGIDAGDPQALLRAQRRTTWTGSRSSRCSSRSPPLRGPRSRFACLAASRRISPRRVTASAFLTCCASGRRWDAPSQPRTKWTAVTGSPSSATRSGAGSSAVSVDRRKHDYLDRRRGYKVAGVMPADFRVSGRSPCDRRTSGRHTSLPSNERIRGRGVLHATTWRASPAEARRHARAGAGKMTSDRHSRRPGDPGPTRSWRKEPCDRRAAADRDHLVGAT